MTKEKLFIFVKTMASPSRTLGIGSVVALPAKIAKELTEAGIVKEYKGKMSANSVYETATAKPDVTADEPIKTPETEEVAEATPKGKGKKAK